MVYNVLYFLMTRRAESYIRGSNLLGSRVSFSWQKSLSRKPNNNTQQFFSQFPFIYSPMVFHANNCGDGQSHVCNMIVQKGYLYPRSSRPACGVSVENRAVDREVFRINRLFLSNALYSFFKGQKERQL